MLFTVFTPTFNRAHTLQRVYDSLCRQSLQDFEWLIIDDGSSDNTDRLVRSWISDTDFPIRYVKQENSGKHVATNKAVKLAEGILFLIADSDDAFPPDALQIFHESWISIPEENRPYFTGVTGLCANENGQIIGDLYPISPFDSTPADSFFKYGIQGEKWGFHRTDVIRKFPFPEPLGFKFVSEGITWNAIGREYKTRYINKIVRYYFQDSGNQLTARSPIDTSPARIFYAMGLDGDIDYITVAPLMLFKIAAQGSRFSFHQKDSFRTQINRLTKWRARCIWLLAMPVGILLFLNDVLRFGRGN